MPRLPITQGSEEWKKVRARNVTATDVWKVYSSKAARDAILRRWETGETTDISHQPAVAYGRGCEARAIEVYSTYVGWLDDGGFWRHPTRPWLFASPDGLQGKDMVVEFKCPYSKIVPDSPPPQYVWQLQTQMAVTGRPYGRIVYWRYLREPGEERDEWERAFSGRLKDELTIFDYSYSSAFDNLWVWLDDAKAKHQFSPFSPIVPTPPFERTFRLNVKCLVSAPCPWAPPVGV